MTWQRVKIDVPDWLGEDDRLQLADDIIEFIKRRTESGVNVDGDAFPPYSKGYVKSLDFDIAGKDPREVNLTLSGDMLAAIELLSHKEGQLTIGFENGTPENARAEGNQLGSYGGEPDKKKARPFLGISDEDLERILSHYREPPALPEGGDA